MNLNCKLYIFLCVNISPVGSYNDLTINYSVFYAAFFVWHCSFIIILYTALAYLCVKLLIITIIL